MREVFAEPEVNTYYQFNISDYSARSISMRRLDGFHFPEEDLPDQGVRFTDDEFASGIQEDAKRYSRPILYLGVEPSGRVGETKVSAKRLARILDGFQDVVKYAYKKAIVEKPAAERRLINKEEYYTWDVYGTEAASFNVKMQSRLSGNLLGQTEIVNAMSILDEVISSIEDFERSAEYLVTYRGHFVSKYLETLRLLSKTKDTLYYSWIPSAYEDVTTTRITYRQAKAFVDHFADRTELGVETVTYRGCFDEIYVSKGKWIFIDEEGKEHKGNAKSEVITLEEITTSVPYVIICSEVLTDGVLPDDEKTELWLQEIKRL